MKKTILLVFISLLFINCGKTPINNTNVKKIDSVSTVLEPIESDSVYVDAAKEGIIWFKLKDGKTVVFCGAIKGEDKFLIKTEDVIKEIKLEDVDSIKTFVVMDSTIGSYSVYGISIKYLYLISTYDLKKDGDSKLFYKK